MALQLIDGNIIQMPFCVDEWVPLSVPVQPSLVSIHILRIGED